MNEKLLSDLSVNEEAEIVEIRGGRGMQARLRALGLAEGQRVKKLSRVGLGGPIIILINRAQVAIGRGMARHIIVGNGGGGYASRPPRPGGRRRGHQGRRIHTRKNLEDSTDG